METLIQAEVSPIDLPARILSSSAEETLSLGKQVALMLKKGSIVALSGPLGAGKTCFVKGIAAGLGIAEEVTSATYTIISEYEGLLPAPAREKVAFYHIDAYRLAGTDDFSAIGGEEIIFGSGISAIEWSEQLRGTIPGHALRVDITLEADGKRLIRIYRGENP